MRSVYFDVVALIFPFCVSRLVLYILYNALYMTVALLLAVAYSSLWHWLTTYDKPVGPQDTVSLIILGNKMLPV